MIYDLYMTRPWWGIAFFIAIILWSLIWKGVGLWYSGKNEQKGWFIAIFIFNTLGLLSIIYLLFFKKDKTIAPPIEITTTTESTKPKSFKRKTKR